jgi:hypothetical protein
MSQPEQLPPVGMELGRPASRPEFDPHAGREHGDAPEPMISTLVFTGVDRGGDFEDTVHQLVELAEGLGLTYVTASVAPFERSFDAD